MHALAALLALSLASLAAGLPSDVKTTVVASQRGWTNGGAKQVSQAQGNAIGSATRLQLAPGLKQLDEGSTSAAVTLQGQCCCWTWQEGRYSWEEAGPSGVGVRPGSGGEKGLAGA